MPETIILTGEEKMEKTIESLKKELSLIRTGRANPAVLNDVRVDYYGVPTPINQMSTISVPEAQQIVIKPFDKTQLREVEKAIQLADLNLVPQSDGVVIRINFPALTEARRKELCKDVKKLEKNKEISEDDLSNYNDEVQKLTDKYIAKVEELVKDKEKQVMEI
ncbi:MAG: ribosome recycling factor [Coprobacillus sp. 28_7]|nr:MAG: ribosome recycling factor [Coprobacillus sp. 28_7]